MLKRLFALSLGLAGLALPSVGNVAPTFADEKDGSSKTLVIDVSMDGVGTWSSTKGDISHFLENKRGDTFIVRGSIYPGGTIPEGDGVFGPDEPGRIGTWLCRGTFNFDLVPDIVNLGAVPHVTTTQTYVLPDSFSPAQELISATTMESDGFEGGVPTRRVLLGGTGNCKGAQGEVLQRTLGMSKGGLFNHRFTFKFGELPSTCRLRH